MRRIGSYALGKVLTLGSTLLNSTIAVVAPGFAPALKFNDARDGQYVPLVFRNF